jgi:hypothetical protein
MQTLYILMVDMDGTLRSRAWPVAAVTTEAEAIQFVEMGAVGYSSSYEKVEVFGTAEDAIRHLMKEG